MQPISQNGGMVGRVTQFAYPGDKDSDYYTRQHLGFRNNILTPHAEALSPSMAQKIHAQPGDVIRIADPAGHQRLGYYADTTAAGLDPRVDLYQPQGYDKSIADNQQVTDLGGGDAKLAGSKLSQSGEANVLRFMGNTPSAVAASAPEPAYNRATPVDPQDLDPSRMPNSAQSITPPQAVAQNSPVTTPYRSKGNMIASPMQMGDSVAQMQNPALEQQPSQPNYSLGRMFAAHPLIASLMGAQ